MSTTTRLGLQILEDATAHAVTLINANDVILDNAALVTIANTFTQRINVTQTPTASTQFGNLNVGDGGFTGGAGHYSGGAGGSLIAVNLVSGGTADLLNLQINGVSKWKLGSGGNVTLGEGSNLVLGTATGSILASTTSQKLAFWGVTPVVQPASNSEIRAALISVGLLAGGVNDLNTNGGAITCGGLATSLGVGGSGTAFPWKRLSLTLVAATDYTLDTTERANVVIDVQSGTGATNIIVPGTASGYYILVNRTAFALTLKTSGGTGITVATLRTAMLSALGGTNMFRLTPDTNYAV